MKNAMFIGMVVLALVGISKAADPTRADIEKSVKSLSSGIEKDKNTEGKAQVKFDYHKINDSEIYSYELKISLGWTEIIPKNFQGHRAHVPVRVILTLQYDKDKNRWDLAEPEVWDETHEAYETAGWVEALPKLTEKSFNGGVHK